MNTKKRNLGLDIIRAFAVLLVMVSHLNVKPEFVGGLKMGQLGVDIFFVLSGFLIGGILIKDYTSEGVNIPVTINFWIRRWFRTLPVYYLVILAKFIFIDNSLGYKVLVYFFFLQNNFVGIEFFEVSWSLVIEEWFYLSLPFFCLLLFYNKTMNIKKFLIFILGFIVFENFLRLGWVLKTNSGFDGLNGNVPFRLDSLMWGVLLALIKIKHKQLYTLFARPMIFAVVAILFITTHWYFGKMNLIQGGINSLLWTRTVWFTINSAFIAMLLPFFEIQFTGNEKPNIFTRSITFISLVSYSAYLIHVEVYRLFKIPPVFTTAWYLQALICISLSLAIAAIMYYFIEKPFMNLRDRIKVKNTRLTVREKGLQSDVS